MIRVLVVDDHAVVRSGLRMLLDAESDIEAVGEAANAERALFEAIELKPDVVLMDLLMPEKGGIEGMPALLQALPTTKVLVLSMQDEPRYVRAAFEAGASGYVLKEAAESDLVAAIREVAGGGRYVHPTLGARMIEAEAAERRRADGGSAVRAGARGPEAARARPDEPGDRFHPLHLGPDGGDTPRAHHAEARSVQSGGARPLCTRPRFAGRRAGTVGTRPVVRHRAPDVSCIDGIGRPESRWPEDASTGSNG